MPVKMGYLIIQLFSVQKCPVAFIRMNFNFKLLMKKNIPALKQVCFLGVFFVSFNGLPLVRQLKTYGNATTGN